MNELKRRICLLQSQRWVPFSSAALVRFVLLMMALLALVSTSLHAQVCGIPGRQGAVALAGTAPNTYFAGAGAPAAGATSFTLATGTNARRGVATNLLAGDLILIIQMQDSTGALQGNYEYAVVTVGGGAGATIGLAAPLVNSYAQNVTVGTVRTYQVVRIPQYAAATLSGTVQVLPWFIEPTNGFGTGGIYAIDVAGALTLNGVTINANGRGFRGARGLNSALNRAGGTPFDANYACTAATINGAMKGEGTSGVPQQVFGFSTTGVASATLTYETAGRIFNAGQGYASGACGQAAAGNAGGGGNDGIPATQTNGLNSGGGGGSNAGAGGIGGNSYNSGDNTTATQNDPVSAALSGLGGFDAGGRGGLAQLPAVASRLFAGGGGGAGGANNGGTDTVTTFPPTAVAGANGAAGVVTSSGAAGGGIVLIRAGTLAVTAASTINAQGLRAYNKSPVASTDSAGGGGGGGTVIIDAPGTPAVSGLTIDASGGAGGNSNYFNHGPGGGGGGGYIATSMSGATLLVDGGAAGTDGCCGGTAGNLSPKNYRASNGAAGTLLTGSPSVLPPGTGASARCLPNLVVTKFTSTPDITATTGATASYTLNVRNTGGAATNLFLFDTGLPPGWVYRTTAPVPVYAYAPAPPLAAAVWSSGAETTVANGVAAPPVLPANSLTRSNSVTAVALRASGAAPGRVPTAGQGSLTFGSFFLPQGGSISVTYGVTIPNTASVSTYHSPAGAVYLDPTRTVTTARLVAMNSNVTANRQALAYSANTSFQSGSTTVVPGGHHSGLVAGPTTDDVALWPDLSVTQTVPATATPGRTFSYVLTPRNNGRALATLSFALTQATDLLTPGDIANYINTAPLGLTFTVPTGLQLSGAVAGLGWTCSGTQTVVCSLPEASAFPRAAATNFPTLTGVVTTACSGGGTKVAAVEIEDANEEVSSINNDATATTVVSPACVNANLTIGKANGGGTLATGQTTAYTITVANLGPGNAPGTVLTDPAVTGLSCSTVSCAVSAGVASCPASPTVGALQSTGLMITPTFNAGSTLTFVLRCTVTATGG